MRTVRLQLSLSLICSSILSLLPAQILLAQVPNPAVNEEATADTPVERARKALTSARQASGDRGLPTALAQFELAEALSHVFGQQRAAALGEARTLTSNAAPILAAAQDPISTEARAAAKLFWSVHYQEPEFETLPAYISVGIGKALPLHRLPTAIEAKQLEDTGEDIPAKLAILERTLGPLHPATAHVQIGGWSRADQLQRFGLNPTAEAGFRTIIRLHLQEEELGLFGNWVRELVTAGRDEDADKLVKLYLDPVAAPERTQLLTNVLRYQSRPAVVALLRRPLDQAANEAGITPSQLMLMDVASRKSHPDGAQRARAALAEFQAASVPDILLTARAQALLADILVGSGEEALQKEAADLAMAAFPTIVGVLGPADKTTRNTWSVVTKAAKGSGQDATGALAALPAELRTPIRLPQVAEAVRWVQLHELAYVQSPNAGTAAAAADLVKLDEQIFGPDSPTLGQDLIQAGVAAYHDKANGDASVDRGLAIVRKSSPQLSPSTIRLLLRSTAPLFANGQGEAARKRVRDFVSGLETSTARQSAWQAIIERAGEELPTEGANSILALAREVLAKDGLPPSAVEMARVSSVANTAISPPVYSFASVEELDAQATSLIQRDLQVAALPIRKRALDLRIERDGASAPATLTVMSDFEKTRTQEPSYRPTLLKGIAEVAPTESAIVALAQIVENWRYLDEPLALAAAKRALTVSDAVHGARSAQSAIAAMRLADLAKGPEGDELRRAAIMRLIAISPTTTEARDLLLAEGRAAASDNVRSFYDFPFFLSAWQVERALGKSGEAIASEALTRNRTLSGSLQIAAFDAAANSLDDRAKPLSLQKDVQRLTAQRDALPAGSKMRIAIEDRLIESERQALVAAHGKDSPEVERFLAENIYRYVPKDDGSLTPTSNKLRAEYYVTELIRIANTRGDSATARERQRLYSFYLTSFGDIALSERVLIAKLTTSQAAGDPGEEGDALAELVGFYTDNGKFAPAEPMLRRRLADEVAIYGDASAQAAAIHVFLGDNLRYQRKDSDARVEYEQAVTIRAALFGADEPITTWVGARIAMIGTSKLPPLDQIEPEKAFRAPVTPDDSRPTTDDERASLARFDADWRTAQSAGDVAAQMTALNGRIGELERLLSSKAGVVGRTKSTLERRAGLREATGDLAGAESDRRRILALVERRFGPNSDEAAEALAALGVMLDQQGRSNEAESLHRRAAAILFQLRDQRAAARLETLLATNLERQGRARDAEPLRRRGLARWDKGSSRLAIAHSALMHNLVLQGRIKDAQREFETIGQSDSSAVTQAEKSKDPGLVLAVGEMLLELERPVTAQRVARRLIELQTLTFGKDSPAAAQAHALLGQALFRAGDATGAIDELSPACAILAQPGRETDAGDQSLRQAIKESGECARALALALRKRGFPEDKAGAFEATQRVELSGAALALSRAGARTAAAAVGAGQLATDFEVALADRRDLDGRLSQAFAAKQTAESPQLRNELMTARGAIDRKISDLIIEIKAKQPRYWDLRSPDPIPLSALQATTGPDAKLLRDNEVLISFLLPPGDARGLVFAVGKRGSAWAEIGMRSDEISELVSRLRREIDPQAYGVGGSGTYVEPFDRAAAHRLSQALLGDPAVAALVDKAGVLLFVPSGVLTTFPPGLLVRRPPLGHDDNPADQRATAWLLREKAIAVLPAVSSLRIFRQFASTVDKATTPLQGFADPDFLGDSPPEQSSAGSTPRSTRSAVAFFRDGKVDPSKLSLLPQLPGTRAEGLALAKELNAGIGSVLFGTDASESQVRRLNISGALGRARVVAFSTHGLVAGDFENLSEPALALARPTSHADPDDDGLLTSSDAMGLRLNAEWVLLSACNTASPDGDSAEGLSGLARAFLYAGARSLLASHWRVSDEAAAAIVSGLFSPKMRRLSKAEALRQSSLAVLDDPKIKNASDPSAWAPFVLIGSPD